jgi:DNA-binding LacI/PurR family transcriptional regulator
MTPRAGFRLPRLEDVARHASVSHQTVSRVINNHPNVSGPTREKVEAAIAKLGYRRNVAARSLVTRRSQTIGVMGSGLSQYGPANTLLGVEQAARDAGYFVSIAALREVSRAALLDATTYFADQGVDGIVVVVPHPEPLTAPAEMPAGIPVVTVGAAGNDNSGGVMVNQALGAELATKHLIAQGHHRIAHISGPPEWMDSGARAQGWRTALRSAGLEADLHLQGDWSAASGYEIGMQLAAQRTATAVFVGNDQMALGLLRAFHETGVRVPDDVSVVGFDDQAESAYFTPPLTTIRQDFEELGRQCMAVVLAALEEAKQPCKTVVDPELVIRASTSAPASSRQ